MFRRCIRESKAFRLLRTKHANANSFALLSASAIFGYAGNTVHASAMQARRLALHVPPVVSVSPRPPVSSGRNMPMQIHLHCSRLLRYSATPEIRFTPRQCKPDGLHCMFRRYIRESKAFRLLRTKHANANSFALLSASAYICKLNFNTITYNGK